MSCKYLISLVATLALLGGTAQVVFASPNAEPDTEVKATVKAEVDAQGEVRGLTRVQADALAAFSWDGETVRVRPLDADGNPYTSAYGDIDRWVWSNVRPEVKVTDLRWDSGRWVLPDDPDAEVVVARVNAEGWLLPTLDTEVEVGPVAPRVLPGVVDSGQYYVIAASTMEPTVRRRYITERARRLAPVGPQVPDWMIREPADAVVFLPQEEYIVRRGDVWIRHDTSGKVVARTQPGQSWRVLYWPRFADVVREANQKKWRVAEYDRYVVVRDADDKVTSIYDLEGQPVQVSGQPFETRPYYYTPLNWEFVGPLREAQTAEVQVEVR